MKRKIAAILAADIAGYSRLVAEDEEETLRRLGTYRAVFSDFVVRYGGRIFNTAGDATLAEFESAVDAVRCAVDVQESLRTRNLAYAPSRQMSFRIGITIGDVVERDGDLLGDGVNIASRLESVAPAGGICISRFVYEAVTNKISLEFDDLGPLQLKNIPDRVHAYAVALDQPGRRRAPRPAVARRVMAVAAVLMIAVAGTAVYIFAWSNLPIGSSPEIGDAGQQIVAAEQGKTAVGQAGTKTPSPSSNAPEAKSASDEADRKTSADTKSGAPAPKDETAPAATTVTPAIEQTPSSATEKNAQADKEGDTCRKYLPSVGKTVAVPCEAAQDAGKSGDVAAKLPLQRHNLRATLGRLSGDDPVPRGWLGVSISDLVPSLAKIVELGDAKGVLTTRVTADGPADRAGLRPGDITLTIDGRKPETTRGFAQIIKEMAPGSEVTLAIARFGQGSTDLMRSLRERADAGSLDAMTALGTLLQTEVGGVKDEAEAARWLRNAADLGDAGAMNKLGFLYKDGRGVAKDEAEAARWYRKAAHLGDPEAMHNLGVLYGSGRGVAKDEAEAVRWYRKAADLGNADAMFNLGFVYGEGQGVGRDEAEAARWYRKAAELGYSPAMHNLGVHYRDGRGVAKDEAEAARWFRKAADLGEVKAMSSLGALHRDGRGVSKDEAAAASWYRKGAEAGDADAMNNLGQQYFSGRGVAKDDAEAARWYRQAAENGSARGMSNLGQMYEWGIGVPKDYAEAERWYRKAVEAGDRDAMDGVTRAYFLQRSP